MAKSRTTLLAAAAAAAAAVTTTTTATPTNPGSRRSQHAAASSSSLYRHPIAAPSFGLPPLSRNIPPPSTPSTSFMRVCQIPRGGDDAATKDDCNASDNDEIPAAAAVAEEPPTTESQAPAPTTHGKKKKKRTRKKENVSQEEDNQTNSELKEGDGNHSDANATKKKNEHPKPKKNTTATSGSSPEGEQQQPTSKTKPSASSASSAAAASTAVPEASVPKHSPIVEQILKEEDYYKILGIYSRHDVEKLASSSNEADAAEAMIKKHYRKRALQTHPDKTGGDRRAFDKVAEAYDVLSDPEKRQVYNRFGKKGLDGSAGGAGGFGGGGAGAASRHAEELFRSFFGAAGVNPFQQQQQSQQQRSRSTINRTARYQLPVTLEDLYRGLTKSVVVAPPPEPDETVIFGNMVYRRPKQQRSKPQQKTVQVHVPRGAWNGQTVVLSGEMDFDVKETPGDIIFSLTERPHATFTRKGHDLAMVHSISLRQALCGRSDDVVLIRHLNGQDIPLFFARKQTSSSSSPAASSSLQQQHDEEQPCMIHDGDVQVVKGLGMPKDAQGTAFGDLYIQFKVAMPSSSSSSLAKKKSKNSNGGDADSADLTLQERQELGRLLDKLLGSSSAASTSSSHDEKDSAATAESDQNKKEIYIMQKGRLADFGRASGKPQMPSSQHDDHHHDPDDDHHYQGNNPFEAGASQFFFSSSMMGGRNPFFSASSSNPFDDGSYHHEHHHDENTQECRQM